MSVIVDLLGLEILSEEHAILSHPNTSGVLLFARNIQSREQVIALVHHLHTAYPELVVFIDQEGGNVVRIQRCGFRALPPARAYGDAYDIDQHTGITLARQYGNIMATDLITCGIDVSLAPILDLHGPNAIIGGLDRAFHADPNVVTALGGAFIEGMHAAGMPAIGKHFPGHGTCSDDSHISMPMDTRSFEEIKTHDLKPFISLINSEHLDGIMPAHITYPAVDAAHATGYSSHWLKTTLREQLNFNGIIVSDCLGMTGADIGSLLTRSLQALEAGCNLLIAANQPREVLLACLNQIPEQFSTENTPYIAQLKENIKRFTHPTASHLISEKKHALNQTKSNANPTKTI